MQSELGRKRVTIDGLGLTVDDVYAVAHGNAMVDITTDPEILKKFEKSYEKMQAAVDSGEIIYGVTTGFGGMADVRLSKADALTLQDNILWYHKTGAGNCLPETDVRAAMLLRANSHLRGVSGIRMVFPERLVTFLNKRATPCVRELGSIGASGDLIPLSYICGALTGHEADYQVMYQGKQMAARDALKELDLEPLRLQPKEGLAMMNGTSVMCGIATNCIKEAEDLFSLVLHIHSLMLQGLNGTNLSFRPFAHEYKPHPGQVWVAENMLRLVEGSSLIRDSRLRNPQKGLVQDRYSLRCLPQYLGPVAENLWKIKETLEIEMNSANDNPLIDSETGEIFYTGNFLGEHVGVAMDQLRMSISLIAKHLDVQIAQLVEPKFSNGLSPCLIGNRQRHVNMGMKGLQISGNSIMPLIQFLGNSLVDRYPTHAEQYNQNINSQGFGSANLARQSIDLLRRYLSLGLIFAIQAVDLRTQTECGTYDAGQHVGPELKNLYDTVRLITERPANAGKPWLWNDDEVDYDKEMNRLNDDLCKYDSKLKAACKVSPRR